MKELLHGFMAVAAIVLLFLAVLYGMRKLNQVASPISEIHPKDGVVCFMVSSTDGVAISCLHEEPKP